MASDEKLEAILRRATRTEADVIRDAPNILTSHNEKMLYLKDFSSELWRIFNKTDYRDDVKKHLDIKKPEDISLISERFSIFMARQVQYYLAKNVIPNSSIVTSYSESGQREAPSYITFQDRNNKRVVSVDNTYLFTKKPFPHIVYLDVGNNSIMFQIYFNTKNKEDAEKYFGEIKESVAKAELFKGAFLQVASSGSVQFLYDIKVPTLYLKRSVREEIELNFDFVIKNKERLQERKLPWRRGILLYGYPGTGKTQLCKQMAFRAVEQGITTIWVTSKSIHDTDDIAAIFTFARNCSPSFLIFEDIDLFAGARDEYEGVRNLLGEFLSQLDGVAENQGIFTTATTNRLFVLDKAISDRPVRFDAKIELDYNDFDSKKALVELFNTANLSIDSTTIASQMTNITPAHVQELLIKSSLISLQSGKQLDTNDVLKIWNQMRPSTGGTEVT